MAASVYSRALQKAVEIVGGYDELCRHLHVPKAELRRWLADQARPPAGVFLRVVDLIIAETPAPDTSSGPEDPPAPRDCAPAAAGETRY